MNNFFVPFVVSFTDKLHTEQPELYKKIKNVQKTLARMASARVLICDLDREIEIGLQMKEFRI